MTYAQKYLSPLLAIGMLVNPMLLQSALSQAPTGGPALSPPAQAAAGNVRPGGEAGGQPASSPVLSMIDVPAAYVLAVSTKLEVKYRDTVGVHFSPDARSEKLIVLAPPELQAKIQAEATQILFSEMQPTIQQVSTAGGAVRGEDGSYRVRLAAITWREFEDSLERVVGRRLPVTTSRNGEQASFQLTGAPLDGTTIQVDRRENSVTVVAPEPTMPGWQSMIQALDKMPARDGEVTEMLRVTNAKPAPIQRAIRMLDALGPDQDALVLPTGNAAAFRNAAFQQSGTAAPQTNPGNQAPVNPGVQNPGVQNPGVQPVPQNEAATDEGSGIIGDTQIQFVPELGIIIVRGAKRDTQRVLDVIAQIERQSVVTQPEIEVYRLKHLNSTATADLLIRLYTDVLSARQGDVSITALDNPNALLLIGRREALASAITLIEKIDTPSDAASQLRVFRLENASALDAEQAINEFFVDRPGQDDDLRPGIGTRVRVIADYRTNSLIVGASPRDLAEVAKLVMELDVQSVPAQNEIRVFPLKNSLAADLAPVLQDAINGEGESTENDNAQRPSTTLSIVSLDMERGGVLDSGILSGVVVTADANANAIIVRAPSSSMALIAELIRQLDQVPGAESVVKVFTIENGDALKLTTSLQELFTSSGGTNTQVGGGNLAGLAGATANTASSLVGLTFATDQRTNSIIASGSANDLEVVESILLRLDTAGFAERITEVIWLRHQSAPEIATAIQTYVQQRTQTVNTIQQFQQGLGPFDLPDRDLVVVAEAVSNSLLLSVSPRLYDDVRRLIDSLDRRPPMVLIKVVLAEVVLGDQFELGGELGLQDSLLFDRGRALPANLPNSVPGFNFNNSGTPNVGVVDPGRIGERAVSTFGLGTTSQAAGYGGFVLSAASESFSLLLRALQDANRAQILSRPQIMTVDNKAGFVNVGQLVSRVNGLQQNVAGVPPILSATDVEVGLTLEVLPRVGADGLISMQILARRSEVDRTTGTGTPIGTDQNGVPIVIPDINETRAQSTITAYSGQTVVFGGLIQKIRTNQSRRVPYLADIPLLGVMFRFDRETETRNELLIIMTPMLITGDEDLEYVKQVESSRMSYCLADVVEMHGDVGLSGGYGLWGPATGPVIYPDLHPTYDQFPQNNVGNSSGSSNACPPTNAPSVLHGTHSTHSTHSTGGTMMEGTVLTGPSMAMPVEGMSVEGMRSDMMMPQSETIIEGPIQTSPTLPQPQMLPTPPVPSQMLPPRGSTLPQNGRRVTTAPSQNFGSGNASAASATGQTTNPPGRFVRSADFKFIDQETAATMSGIAQEPIVKP